jgi:hypothetical protein
MITLNISFILHLICIFFISSFFRYFFDTLYEKFMLYKEEEKIKESLFQVKKKNIEELQKEVTMGEHILHNDLLNYIRESIILSKKEYIKNDELRYTIAIHNLTENDKELIINQVKKVIKKSFKEG